MGPTSYLIVRVSGFKVPSAEELDHDYLWRYARRLPARGDIGAILAHTLIEIDPQYPEVSADKRQQLLAVKHELEKEAATGAPADPFAAKATARKEAKAQDGQGAGGGHRLHEHGGQPARASRARSRAAHQDGAAQAAAPVSPARSAATQNHPTQPSPRSARPRVKSQRGPRAAEGEA
jgi:hypothetical protein